MLKEREPSTVPFLDRLHLVQFQQRTMPLPFSDALLQLPAFCEDNTADLDLAYDWICEITEINNICDDKGLWHQFYEAFTDAAPWHETNWHTVA